MIFDTISIKAHWGRRCRWNCDLRVINAWKKPFSVVPKASPRRPTSLWGVAAKWPTRTLKTKLILCLKDLHGYSHISLSLWGRILKECHYSMGFVKSHSLKCLLHKWVWCGAARKSDHLNCIKLIHFRLTAGWLRGSLCIVIPAVIWELLQFTATQKAGMVNFFVDHMHTQFTEESKMATALTPQTDVISGKSRDWWRTRDCSLGQPTENKID